MAELEDSRGALRQFLTERDINCPACGYLLRGCQSSKCPECGTEIELHLRGRPAPFWWHAGILGLAIAEALLTILFLRSLPLSQQLAGEPVLKQQVQMGFAPQSELIQWPTLYRLAGAVAAGAVLLGWFFISRRRFAHWPAAAQIGAGLFGAVAPVFAVALLRLLAW